MNETELSTYILSIDWDTLSEPRYWFYDSPTTSLIINGFSIGIPFGEFNCIKALKEIAPHIKNSELKSKISDFITEECNHSLIHKKFNQYLKKFGYPVNSLTHQYQFLFKLFNKNYSIKTKAAIACAIEHISTSIAIMCIELKLPYLGHSKICDFMYWHCLEEFNHRAYLYDVYKDLGGGYFRRIFAYIPVFFIVVGMGSFAYHRLLFFDIYHKKYFKYRKKSLFKRYILLKMFLLFSKKLFVYLFPGYRP